MGVRFRKSINLGGGFRVNISKSGVGYSWGVKGYRITKTARGTLRQTISIPGTGLSYSTETKIDQQSIKQTSNTQKDNTPIYKTESGQPVQNIQNIESAEVEEMRPAEYSDLFSAVKKITTVFSVITACGLVGLFIHPLITFAFIAAAIWFVRTQYVTLDYAFDDYALEQWARQNAAWQDLALCKKLWYVTMTASTSNRKTNAGAATAINYSEAKICKSLPWYLKSELKPLIIKTKKQQYLFMPDRILIIEGNKIGAVSYKDVQFQFGIQPLAGSLSVPRETEIMEYRWMKVNKNGEPDRRFKDNKKVPVYKLGSIIMNSKSGLNVMLLTSRVAPVEAIEKLMENHL